MNTFSLKLEGRVVSDKMAKTVVVEILRLKKHPKYKKYMKASKRYKAHDEEGKCHVGDMVVIQETRPLSKEKRWVVTEIRPRVVKENVEEKEEA